jgi:3-deoxy-D-manno-octulosonate 8-phosphate phosphatase (KDO 8-P phosphatase)
MAVPTIDEYMSKIKVIVSEVDGVLNDGISAITESGVTLYKFYYQKDFEAINRLKREFKFVFLSTDNYINYNLCNSKNIAFFWAKINKKEQFVEILRKNKVTPENVLYIGSGLSDIECIKMVPFSVCPIDAPNEVKLISYDVLKSQGGFGVFNEIYSMLKPEIDKRKRES